MDEKSPDDEYHDLWVLLAHTYRLIGRMRDKELHLQDSTPEQAYLLTIIHNLGEEATPSNIKRYQVQAHNTVSEIIDRMKKRGLVEKISRPDGRKRITVKLTEKGLQAYLKSQKRTYLNRVMGALTCEQREQLSSCLEIVRDKVLEELGQLDTWPEIRVKASEWRSGKPGSVSR